METSLHRSLKEHFAQGPEGRTEVAMGGFRIDAVGVQGELIEIQLGALGSLRGKLARLLPRHHVRVIKPITVEKRVVRKKSATEVEASARRSPKRGGLVDFFEDLVGLARCFPHPNLTIEVLPVSIDEIRVIRRRRPGYTVVDRRLTHSQEPVLLKVPEDLWKLIPEVAERTGTFTTEEIARLTERPLWLAQRVAYCLRLSGAVEVVGKCRNSVLYEIASAPRAGRQAARVEPVLERTATA